MNESIKFSLWYEYSSEMLNSEKSTKGGNTFLMRRYMSLPYTTALTKCVDIKHIGWDRLV